MIELTIAGHKVISLVELFDLILGATLSECLQLARYDLLGQSGPRTSELKFAILYGQAGYLHPGEPHTVVTHRSLSLVEELLIRCHTMLVEHSSLMRDRRVIDPKVGIGSQQGALQHLLIFIKILSGTAIVSV